MGTGTLFFNMGAILQTHASQVENICDVINIAIMGTFALYVLVFSSDFLFFLHLSLEKLLMVSCRLIPETKGRNLGID